MAHRGPILGDRGRKGGADAARIDGKAAEGSIGGAGGNGTVTYTQITIPTKVTQELTLPNVAEDIVEVYETVKAPKINLDTTTYSEYKTIEIDYIDGYINEYSLDLGETWNIHTGNIKVEENTTILTRIVDGNGEVLSSSSLVITTIDNTKANVELEIPESITVGDEYSLPTGYTLDKSGGNVECKTGDTVITNTKELSAGTYEIVCTVKTNSGKEANITKNIVVNKKEEKVEENKENIEDITPNEEENPKNEESVKDEENEAVTE